MYMKTDQINRPLVVCPSADHPRSGQSYQPRPMTQLRFVLSRDVVSTTNRGMRQYNGLWQMSKPYHEYQLHVFFMPSNYVNSSLLLIASGIRITGQNPNGKNPNGKKLDLASGRFLEDEVSVFLSKFTKNESGQLVDVSWIQVVHETYITARRASLFKMHFPKWKPNNRNLMSEYEKLMKRFAGSRDKTSYVDTNGKSYTGSARAQHYSNLLDKEKKKADAEQAGLMQNVYAKIGFKVYRIEDVEFSKPILNGMKKFFFEEEIEEAVRKWHQLIDLVEPAG